MVRGVRAVPVVDAVIQAWNQLPMDRATSMILDGARRDRFRAADLAERIADYPRIRGRRALVRLLGELRGGIESYLEHLASTRVFNTRDFAGFRRQAPVRACGQRFVLDMFHEHARVAVELDGRAFPSDDSDRRRDLARDAILASVGIMTIRLTFEDITQRPEWCRARVRNALSSARRRGAG
jgi:very-short-patch-repair endonuclease